MNEEKTIDIELYSTKQVRKLLRLGNKKCLELLHSPDFPSVKVGKSFFVKKSALEEYLNHRHIL